MTNEISSVATRWLRLAAATLAAIVLCHFPTAAGADPLPAPWTYADVGAVGVPGSATFSSSPGGGTMFTDTRGRVYIGYHGWDGASSPCTGDSPTCTRMLFVARVNHS